MNQAVIIGRCTRDAELRYTTSGSPVMTLSVATNETRGGGETRKTIVEFHTVTAFGRYVESLAPKLKKGSEVFVLGKVTTRSWNDKQTGLKREKTEISAQTIRMTQEKGMEVAPTDAELQRAHAASAAADESDWNM